MASWSLNQFILSWTHFNVQRLNDTDINKCTPKGWPEENEAKACSNTHLDNRSTLYQLLYPLVQIWRFSTNPRDADLWGWHSLNKTSADPFQGIPLQTTFTISLSVLDFSPTKFKVCHSTVAKVWTTRKSHLYFCSDARMFLWEPNRKEQQQDWMDLTQELEKHMPMIYIIAYLCA